MLFGDAVGDAVWRCSLVMQLTMLFGDVVGDVVWGCSSEMQLGDVVDVVRDVVG